MNRNPDIHAAVAFENLKAFYRAGAEAANIKMGSFLNVDWFFASKSHWPLAIIGKVEEKFIPKAIEQMEKKQIPPVWIIDKDRNRSFYHQLKANDFYEVMRWKNMYLLPEDMVNVHSDKPGVVVKRIDPRQHKDTFRTLLYKALLKNRKVHSNIFDLWFSSDNHIAIGAFENNELQSIGIAHIYESQAGLYMIATHPAHERKGLATLVVQKLVQQSLEAGAKCVYLQASQAGEKVYKRIGFTPTGDVSIFWKLGLF